MKKRITQILFFFCTLLFSLQAEAILIEKEPKNPNWIGNFDPTASEGAEYWATFLPNNGMPANESTLKLSIQVVTDSATTVIVEVGNQELTRLTLADNSRGNLILSNADVYMAPEEVRSAKNKGIHIYSEDRKTPFSCYAYSEAGTGDGSTRTSALLLSTHVLGTQYYVQTYQTDINATEFAVVATEDNTNALLKIVSGDPDNPELITQTLQRGQVYMVRRLQQSEEVGADVNLSGSYICADKPIAVFQGNDFAKVRQSGAGGFSGNHMFNQAFPTEQLGTEYYIGLTEHARSNGYNILATEDGTSVSITNSGTITLNAGQSLSTPYWLNASGAKYARIKSDKPIIVTHYQTSGNFSEADDYLWGNPTSATMIPWERRFKESSFFTTQVGDDSEISLMYVQVAAQTNDMSKFKLDGQNISVSFSRIPNLPSMAVANIEIPTEGRHTLENTGDGFVGFVYAITSNARAYEYTLDVSPKPLFDSLYVTNTENIMDTVRGYNLEKVEGRGWYQRQWEEWKRKTERLDTALVCDSTEVSWAVYTPAEKPIEQIDWTIYNVTWGQTEKEFSGNPAGTAHTYSYQFILPEEQEDERHAFFDYKIQAVLYRTMEKCDNRPALDTFQTVVRVTRMYNDTTWMIVCAGDIFEYFNDTTLTNPSESYTTTFYYEETPATEGLEHKIQYHLGENFKTQSYESQGGCDSIRTLKFFVCDTSIVDMNITICEDSLVTMRSKLGYFFDDINFVTSFKNKTASDPNWKKQADGSYIFKGESTIKTTSCMSEELMNYISHGAKYNGCDSTIILTLRVMPVEIRDTAVNICEGSYDWYDDDGNFIKTINRKEGENYKTPKTYPHSIKYTVCTNCPTEGCDSVRYELRLMFVDGLSTDTIHLCQNAADTTYTHKEPLSAEKKYTWPTFDPKGKNVGIYSYEDQPHRFVTPGCTYTFFPVFIVDTVLTYRDSVVYCYEEGKTQYHSWGDDHKTFWLTEKGQNNWRKAQNIIVKFDTLSTRMIYELTDTAYAQQPGECDVAYNQVVIFMPDYKHGNRHDMSDEDTYPWDGKLLVGENAHNYENPDGLTVVEMRPEKPSSSYPWTSVNYDPTIKEYTIINATKTVRISDNVPCDSIDTLHLRIGPKFDSTYYEYTCSDVETYRWRKKDRVIPYTTKDTVIIFYDSLKTTWPVKGLDSVYILNLNVYHAFTDTTMQVNVCQDRQGYQWWPWAERKSEGHNLYINGVKMDPTWDSIPTIKTGHYYVTDSMKAQARTFRPGTAEEAEVQCDSVWVLDLMVNTTYDSTFTMIGGDTIVLKSNDTLTYFNPKTLFIGKDFDYAAHGVADAPQLAAKAGITDWTIVTRDSMYSKTALSQFYCDSTSYKYIEICWLKKENLTKIIGDNDTTLLFGGDTTPDEYGVREHTQKPVTGWMFHVGEDGRPIDYKSDGRPVRTREYVDTLHTAEGCDSIVHLSLTIYPAYQYDTADYTCHNQTYNWREHTNLNLLGTDSIRSVAYDTINYHSKQSGGVVDSMYILELTIYPGVYQFFSKTLCYNDTVTFRSTQVIYTPEFDLDSVITIYQADGDNCGNKYVLAPTFNPAYGYGGDPNYADFADTITNGVCQNEDYYWRNKKVPTNEFGWHIMYDSLKTVNCNCDSIYTLYYYVTKSYKDTTYKAICIGDEYVWTFTNHAGDTHTKDTIYTSDVSMYIYDAILDTTVFGCDSSYYLQLFVDQPYDTVHHNEIHVDTTLCPGTEHFEWKGDHGLINYDDKLQLALDTFEAMEFFDTLTTQTVRGLCDSVVCLHLIIAPAKDSIWKDTICTGETYYLYDTLFTTGGTHEYIRINEYGCESKYILLLEEIPPTVVHLNVEPVCVDEHEIANYYTIRYTYEGKYAPISYSIRYDSIAAELGFEDEDSVPILTSGELQLPIPVFTPHDAYPRPGYYDATIAFDNGVCLSDSLMTYPFKMEMRYPSWITTQHWNDAIFILDSTLNGGYAFTAYQWYRNDSILHGETRPYLYEPQYLQAGAQYSVALTRSDDQVIVRTCPIVPDLSVWYDKSPQQAYVSVVPTVVSKQNPIVYILSVTSGTYRLLNPQGQLLYQSAFTPDARGTYPVQLPASSGVYIFHLTEDTTYGTGGDLSRTVKVIVQ